MNEYFKKNVRFHDCMRLREHPQTETTTTKKLIIELQLWWIHWFNNKVFSSLNFKEN